MGDEVRSDGGNSRAGLCSGEVQAAAGAVAGGLWVIHMKGRYHK